jgi:hypothetical protein
MNRRGLFAAFALSPFIAVNAIAKERPTGEPDTEQPRLVLNGTEKLDPSERMRITSDGFVGIGTSTSHDPHKQVSMSVGEDGHLWIKTAYGQWKRVVTE